jgi:hypothetical protein
VSTYCPVTAPLESHEMPDAARVAAFVETTDRGVGLVQGKARRVREEQPVRRLVAVAALDEVREGLHRLQVGAGPTNRLLVGGIDLEAGHDDRGSPRYRAEPSAKVAEDRSVSQRGEKERPVPHPRDEGWAGVDEYGKDPHGGRTVGISARSSQPVGRPPRAAPAARARAGGT